MRSRRREAYEQQERERLVARVQSLEQRVMLLEARIRRSITGLRPVASTVKRSSSARPRPRCPGCLLELPKGKRGETCVWCGFVFSAVGPLRKPKRPARRPARRRSG